MSTNSTVIVMATDAKYYAYTSVTIQSLITNRDKNHNYKIYVFHTSLKNKETCKMKRMSCKGLEVKCINVTEYIAEFQGRLIEREHFTEATYYRLLIPQVLNQYNEVIYLDSDLVVNVDIAQITKCDLGTNLIAAVNHPYVEKGAERYIRMGMDPYNYINAGVLVINTKLWKEENIAEKSFKLLKEIPREELLYLDQDVINIACLGRIKELSPKWNYMWHYVYGGKTFREAYDSIMEEVGEDPFIIHYSSGKKPWNTDRELGQQWHEYAKQSSLYQQEIRRQKKKTKKKKAKKKIKKFLKKIKKKIRGLFS